MTNQRDIEHDAAVNHHQQAGEYADGSGYGCPECQHGQNTTEREAGIAQERERWLAWIEEEQAKLSNCGLVDGVAWLMLGRLRARAQEKP